MERARAGAAHRVRPGLGAGLLPPRCPSAASDPRPAGRETRPGRSAAAGSVAGHARRCRRRHRPGRWRDASRSWPSGAFPVDELRYFASARSAGRTLPWEGAEIVVEDAATADLTGLDIALFSAGAASSRELAPRFAAAGAVVIDNSSAWRMDPDVPLVVAEVNAHALDSIPKGIVANPNCTTMAAMPVLKPLHDEAGLRRLVASTYQAVSGAGAGRRRTSSTSRCGRWSTAPPRSPSTAPRSSSPRPYKFARPIAFNVLPLAGKVVDDGTRRDRRGAEAPQREPQDPGHPRPAWSSGTCVRVPVFTGHSLSINAEFDRPITPAEATDALAAAPGVVADRRADAARGRGAGPGLRRAHPPRRVGARRPGPRAVRVQRQPAQGRRAQRRPDRRGARPPLLTALSRGRRPGRGDEGTAPP